MPITRSILLLALALAACGEQQAAQDASEPATAPPSPVVRQAGPQTEPQQGTSAAGAPAAGSTVPTGTGMEPGDSRRSYEQCMAEATQLPAGGARASATGECAALPDAPK